jgi:hypothetical protein
MDKNLNWKRRFPDSKNNFYLEVTNPQDLDSDEMNELLKQVLEEEHRGLKLSLLARNEFQRWFSQPTTPLKSSAYVLLSNWFMTRSGDRHSGVATRCEALWDALFPCRPAGRLSSPEPGKNHVMLPTEFERFWQQLRGENAENGGGGHGPAEPNVKPLNPTSERLRAKIDKKGLHCEVEGSPRALADFLQMVSDWEGRESS